MVMSGLEALTSGQAVLTGLDTTNMNEDRLAACAVTMSALCFKPSG